MPKPARSRFAAIALASAVGIAAVAYLLFFKEGRGEAEPQAPAAVVVRVTDEAPPEPPRTEAPAPPKEEAPRPVPAVPRLSVPLSPPPIPVSHPPQVVKTVSSEVAGLMAAGRWREARAALAARFSEPIPDAERTELAARGIEISRQLLQTKPDEADVEMYEIQQGDTLEGIARKFKAVGGVKGSIMLVNNYKENAILRSGRKVRVAKGAWSIVVDKSLFKLWVCCEGAPFKGYTVTIGTEEKTPAAKFAVGVRNPKPAWWPPAEINFKGKVPVPYGDPANPLGEWWISLDSDLHHGLGIHGTNDPKSIGSKASNGCVRMLNEEVGEVAALAFKGMAVTIVE
jgi:hypothetical protein